MKCNCENKAEPDTASQIKKVLKASLSHLPASASEASRNQDSQEERRRAASKHTGSG